MPGTSARPKVFVTGAAGYVGMPTVQHLVESGFPVKGVDQSAEHRVEGAEYALCDITDVAALKREMAGCDAVLHLAAITLPWRAAPGEIYRINCHGTFCVFQAAGEIGIRRVVCASSINALGCWFGQTFPPPHYLPMDEEHPTCTTDVYSFSKVTMEATAAYFWRRDRISSVCFRMGGRMRLDPRPVGEETRCLVRELMLLPEGQGRRQIEGWIAVFFAHRQIHPSESWQEGDPRSPAELSDAASKIINYITHFWTALDDRDRAQAFEKALVSEYEGSHPLFINDNHNCLGIESQALAELCYPGARPSRPLQGTESLISIEKARALIGFQPEYSVSRYLDHPE